MMMGTPLDPQDYEITTTSVAVIILGALYTNLTGMASRLEVWTNNEIFCSSCLPFLLIYHNFCCCCYFCCHSYCWLSQPNHWERLTHFYTSDLLLNLYTSNMRLWQTMLCLPKVWCYYLGLLFSLINGVFQNIICVRIRKYVRWIIYVIATTLVEYSVTYDNFFISVYILVSLTLLSPRH